jgi:hypothetical protein
MIYLYIEFQISSSNDSLVIANGKPSFRFVFYKNHIPPKDVCFQRFITTKKRGPTLSTKGVSPISEGCHIGLFYFGNWEVKGWCCV